MKKPSPKSTPKTDTPNLPAALREEIKELRRSKQLHARVTSALVDAVHELFPDWVCIPEIGQTPGGRNDAVLFECAGESVCFEVFATKSQVPRDLLLLHNSTARAKIAVLVDREVDDSVAEAYYRNHPSDPFPAIWISDVLNPKRRSFLQLKLTQLVLGDRMAEYIVISRQLAQTAHNRILRSWKENGIEIYSVEDRDPTFAGVLALLAVKHFHALELPLEKCEGAARIVSRHFDYIIRQILFGIPMYLVLHQQEYSLWDFTDFRQWELGLVIEHEADYVTVLLNSLYNELKKAYKGDLPEAGDMVEMIRLTLH